MTPLQSLNAMIRADFKEKHPEIPDRLAPNKPMKCNSANSLTQCIIKYIKLTGGQAERISTTGRMLDQSKVVTNVLGQRYRIGSSKYIPGTGTRGSADISAIVGGRSLKIEVKYGRDRQSSEQVAYQSSVEKAGGIYYLARTFDEFYEWYNNKFIQ
jgi:hypothetical protein